MELIPQFFAILLVLALLGAAMWLLRRKNLLQFSLPGKAAGLQRLQTVERLHLTPQHAVFLLRVGDRAVLISSHAAGCTLLETLSWKELENAQEWRRP
jgi:flagellar biogenesis protein FliO